MALKAGYYGVKKNILDELEQLDGILPAGVSKDNKLATAGDINASVTLLDDTVGWIGKNMFMVTATNHTKNDVIFTIDNGVVELSGTSTGDINVGSDNGTLGTISGLTVGETYILSGCPEGGSSDTYRLVIRNDTTTSEYYVDTGNGIEFTAKDVTYTVYIRANSGINLTGKIFKAMISKRKVYVYSPIYEPYHESVEDVLEELSDNKVDKISTILSSTDDLNNIKTAGFYCWELSVPTNAPEALTYGTMIVNVNKAGANSVVHQIVVKGGVIYQRIFSGSPLSWKPWYKFTGTEVTPQTQQASAPETREASDPEPEPETKTTKRSSKKTETTE